MSHADSTLPPDSLPIAGTANYRVSSDGTIWTNFLRGGQGRVGPWIALKPGTEKKYGHQRVKLSLGNGKYRQVGVHVLVLETFVGPCPEGMEGRHFPDRNPRNNNVRNLGWATRANNAADTRIHGTNRPGEECHLAKLKDEDIPEIFRLAREGHLCREIAETYGVDSTTIYYILKRKTWSHIPIPDLGLIPKHVLKGEDCPGAKIKAEDIPEIFRLSKDGLDQGEIAEIYGISRVQIGAILARRKWKHIPIAPDLAVEGSLSAGERHPQAKLTDGDIGEIFRLSRQGLADREIGERYEVSQSAVAAILRRDTWSHVPIESTEGIREGSPKGERHGGATLKDSAVIEIFRLRSEGVSGKEIAERIGTSQSTVSTILHRKTWSHVPIPAEYLPRPRAT